MNNIENLYEVIKNFLPLAGNYLKGTTIEPYLPQLENTIKWIDSLGGIQTITKLFQSITPNNSPNTNISTQKILPDTHSTQTATAINKMRNIDTYTRIVPS